MHVCVTRVTELSRAQVLSRWALFGSSFFAVRRVGGGEWREHVLALNRRGVHLLHPATHETDTHWPYAELISTRKVSLSDGCFHNSENIYIDKRK